MQALELSLETLKRTWKVKADPLTWQSPFWINSLTCRWMLMVALILGGKIEENLNVFEEGRE